MIPEHTAQMIRMAVFVLYLANKNYCTAGSLICIVAIPDQVLSHAMGAILIVWAALKLHLLQAAVCHVVQQGSNKGTGCLLLGGACAKDSIYLESTQPKGRTFWAAVVLKGEKLRDLQPWPQGALIADVACELHEVRSVPAS